MLLELDDVFKRQGGRGKRPPGAPTARGRKGAPVPKSAPVHTGPKVGSKAWHAGKREAMAHQAAAVRAKHGHGGVHKLPPVRHGGFKCSNCGHMDWREHPVVTREGKHHATLAFQGCARCGTMHASHVGVSKTVGEPVDVVKDVDATETAVQRQDAEHHVTDLVGHRTDCPRGGSGPCGAEKAGRCTRCNARVQDHYAVGKTLNATVLDLRELAGL